MERVPLRSVLAARGSTSLRWKELGVLGRKAGQGSQVVLVQ